MSPLRAAPRRPPSSAPPPAAAPPRARPPSQARCPTCTESRRGRAGQLLLYSSSSGYSCGTGGYGGCIFIKMHRARIAIISRSHAQHTKSQPLVAPCSLFGFCALIFAENGSRTAGCGRIRGLLHGWTGEGAGIPLNSEVISTRSSTPHHAIHDGIASTARGAGGAHHGVGYAPRPRAYGPRASTDTRGGSPSAAGQAGGR